MMKSLWLLQRRRLLIKVVTSWFHSSKILAISSRSKPLDNIKMKSPSLCSVAKFKELNMCHYPWMEISSSMRLRIYHCLKITSSLKMGWRLDAPWALLTCLHLQVWITTFISSHLLRALAVSSFMLMTNKLQLFCLGIIYLCQLALIRWLNSGTAEADQ